MNGGPARRAAPGRPAIQSVVRLEEYHALFTGPEQCDRLASLLCATGEKIWNASAGAGRRRYKNFTVGRKQNERQTAQHGVTET
ncbi:hypothetical protein [Achromobacter aloeverae]